MSNLFNIGVSGMSAMSDNLAIIGNNISNSSTCAYKTNNLTFQEMFVSHSGQYANGILVQYGNGVSSTGVTSDWSSGSIESTGEEANIALTGDGFFCVSYNNSIYYTRAGDFSLVETVVDPSVPTSGYVLMRSDGSMLLGGDGVDATTNTVTNVDSSSYVYFTECPTSFEIASDGTVSAVFSSGTGSVVNGYVGIQRFNNPDSLERIEGGLYRSTSMTSYSTTDPSVAGQNGTGTMLQGSLEQSNVDLATEFTDLIQAQRAFQGCSKVITVADELLQTVLGMI